MAKIKTTKQSTLKSFEDVDENLRQISLINIRLSDKESEMNSKILEAQKTCEDATKKDREYKLQLEKDIELFCNDHKEEFIKSKSRSLNFGIVSFRLSPGALKTLKGYTWDNILAILEKLEFTQYIKTKKEVDKDKIKAEITEATELAEIGLHITQGESFYYEAFEKKIV